ncbi:MAG: YdcF family protein [Trueperaceae bacterium]
MPHGRLRSWLLAPLVLLMVASFDLVGIAGGPGSPDLCPGGTGLVLGAAQYDGRPSPAFERRLRSALEAYRTGCVDRLIVSGGSQPGDRTSEGAAGVAWLAAHGVPSSDLIAESLATSTEENVRFARPHLHVSEVLLISDDLHAWRAAWHARRQGLRPQVRTVPAGGNRPAYLLREWSAMLASRIGLSP